METYKTTKTIRFKLEPQNATEIEKVVKNLDNNSFDLVSFVSYLNNYIDDMSAYLFYEKQDRSFAIKDKMTIKREWLRLYAKQGFAEYSASQKQSNSRRAQITIKDIAGLSEKIEKVFDEIDEIYTELCNDASADLNERAKRAKTGLLFKRLSAKNVLPFLSSLVENTTDKNETDDLSIRINKQSQEIEKQLLTSIQAYLPQQSEGLPIAKASLNYYTINKKHIDYSSKIKELKDKLRIDADSIFSLTKENLSNDIKNAIKSDIQKEIKDNKVLLLGDAPMLRPDKFISLRQTLKNIKAEQKKQFLEMMQDNCTYQQLKKSKLYLLNDIQQSEFNSYTEKTQKLKELGTELSNQNIDENTKRKLRSKKQQIAKERGDIMKDSFQTWKSFAHFYRTISQKHGKILAQLKGIEKEQTESQLLKYWAVILQKNSRHKLILIPKENASECKKLIETYNSTNSNACHLFWFESLTYRSLQKLCFGFAENGNNEFNAKIKKLLPKDDRNNTINGEYAFKGDEHEKIKFYQNVLKSDYTKQVLNIPVEQIQTEIINATFNNLDDFKIALEKICYRRFVLCSQSIEDELTKYNAQVFDITSLDLKNSSKNNIKSHTQIWKNFWDAKNEQNNYDIRLNPEITITYRQPKESRVVKYGENSTLYDNNKRNRYLYPQFTLITTISEHSNSPTKILSFMQDDEFKRSIDEFNTKLKKEDVKFAFGIDNGEVELSTLGVYLPDYNKTTNEEKTVELKNVEKYGFKVITIRNLHHKEVDKNGKERRIIQNPSYFLSKENYIRTFEKTKEDYDKMFKEQFEEKTLLTLDLTTAKVINGYIVTNGDIPALFNLWLKHAQRNIYEMNDHAGKETAKNITLKSNEELTSEEKTKFIEYLNSYSTNSLENYNKSSNTVKKEKYTAYHSLTEDERREYTKWIFDFWDKRTTENKKFENIKNGKDENGKNIGKQQKVGSYSKYILFAICSTGKDLQTVTDLFDVRNIFKKRKEFYSLKSEEEIKKLIESYNTRSVSNEELDLKIVQVKNALVANAIGVINFLYRQYKQRFNGEGLIVKEGFDTKKVEQDIEKFSGNIYRIIERKLYQKFQNYGLVPPIKTLMLVRDAGIDDKTTTDIMRLGNIGFVSKSKTSGTCPICEKENLKHGMVCPDCHFDFTGILHSNDGIAGFNIAKRGFENFNTQKQ
jgi:hypothetical protein